MEETGPLWLLALLSVPVPRPPSSGSLTCTAHQSCTSRMTATAPQPHRRTTPGSRHVTPRVIPSPVWWSTRLCQAISGCLTSSMCSVSVISGFWLVVHNSTGVNLIIIIIIHLCWFWSEIAFIVAALLQGIVWSCFTGMKHCYWKRIDFCICDITSRPIRISHSKVCLWILFSSGQFSSKPAERQKFMRLMCWSCCNRGRNGWKCCGGASESLQFHINTSVSDQDQISVCTRLISVTSRNTGSAFLSCPWMYE